MDPPPAKHIVQCISPQFSINKRKFSFSEYVGEHHVACTLLTNMSVQLLQIFQRKSISFHRPYHFIDTVSLYLLVVTSENKKQTNMSDCLVESFAVSASKKQTNHH